MLAFALAVCGGLLITLLAGCRAGPCLDRDDAVQRLNGLRGFFAVEIVAGHAGYFSGNVLLYMLGESMLIGVAYFFFVSGLGLARAYERDKGYLRGFFLRRCVYLLALAAVCYLQNELIRLALSRHEGFPEGIIAYIFKRVNWYVWELLAFYLIFWAVYSFAHRRKVLYVSILTALLAHVMYCCHLQSAYYISAVGFPLGLLFYTYYDRVTRFLRSPKGLALTAASALLGLGGLWLQGDIFSDMYIRNFLCFAAVVIVTEAVRCVRFGNPVLRFLGEYSVEIYFYQFIVLEIIPAGWDPALRVVLTVAGTIAMAMLMHPISRKIKALCQRPPHT